MIRQSRKLCVSHKHKPIYSPLLGYQLQKDQIKLFFNHYAEEKRAEIIRSMVRMLLASHLLASSIPPNPKAVFRWKIGHSLDGTLFESYPLLAKVVKASEMTSAPNEATTEIVVITDPSVDLYKAPLVIWNQLYSGDSSFHRASVEVRCNPMDLLVASWSFITANESVPLKQIELNVVDRKKSRIMLTWTFAAEEGSELFWLFLESQGIIPITPIPVSDRLDEACQLAVYRIVDPQTEEERRLRKEIEEREKQDRFLLDLEQERQLQLKLEAKREWEERKLELQEPHMAEAMKYLRLTDNNSSWHAYSHIDYGWKLDCVRPVYHDDNEEGPLTPITLAGEVDVSHIFPNFFGNPLLLFRTGFTPNRSQLSKLVERNYRFEGCQYEEFKEIWYSFLRRALAGKFWLQQHLVGLSLTQTDDLFFQWEISLWFDSQIPEVYDLFDDFIYELEHPLFS